MSKTVLVVDDDKLARHSLMATLKGLDLEVTEAADGKEGLAQAKQGPDLIVTDIHMPEMDGLAMVAALRKDDKTKDIPVIVLTVDEAPSTINQALAAGVTVYLSKSGVNPQAIADQVVNALG
jgi:CheY-like chemotaxis protein